MVSSIMEVSGIAKDFNRYAINYVIEREYFYQKSGFDFEGLRLESYLVESYYIARKIIEAAMKDDNFLDSKYMIAQQCQKPLVSEHDQKCFAFLTFYDFCILSSALMSIAEDKNNEELEMFCILKLDEALDSVYNIAYDGIMQIRNLYD